MELLLIKIVALFRPLVSIQYAATFADVIAIGLFGLLVGALLLQSALRQSLRMSAIDGMIVAFTVWCLVTSVIYYEGVLFAEVAKLLIPLLSYTLVKNTVPNQREYRRLLFWIIIGFSVPTLVSAALVALGSPTALGGVNYWSHESRWQGVYENPHTFGHSMTLLLITLVLYVSLRRISESERREVSGWVGNALLALLGVAALYCLYMSLTRTAIVGLLTFLAILSYTVNKRVFIFGGGILAFVLVVTSPYWLATLNPELGAEKMGVKVEVIDYGSGRPRLWLNDITVFAERPIDEQLAGNGIGNRAGDSAGGRIYGHNDWLEVLTQTGLIGFLLFATLQVLILKKILKMQGKERYAFLALFAAVNLMMFLSNSYVWRIQVGQLYYMILAFIEIPTNRLQTESARMQGTVNAA